MKARGYEEFSCIFRLWGSTLALTWHFILLLLVDGAGEGVSQGNGGKEHFNANDEILPACCHRASTHFVTVDGKAVGYDVAALQNGEDHP